MVAWLRTGVAVTLAALLGACAQLPSAAKVKAFGDATAKLSSIYKDSVSLNTDLAQRLGDEKAVHKFLIGDQLGKKPNSDFVFPPDSYATLSKQALQAHSQLIAAIGAYGKALAKAADTGTITDLEAAATNLGAAVGTAIAPLTAGAAVPIISPAAKLVGQGIGLAVANTYAVEIREIMVKTHPVLKAAATELKNTFAVIKYNNNRKLRQLRADMKANLRTVRFDPTVSRNVLSAEYRAGANDYRALVAKSDALANSNGTLDALVKAHKALLENSPNSDAELTNFLDLVKQVGDLASAMKPEK